MAIILSLYGTAAIGGTHDRGTVFRITPKGTFTVYSFEPSDAEDPNGALVQATNGMLYGTTICCWAGAHL